MSYGVFELNAVPDVIVTVVTHNSANDVETCVRSLAMHFPLLEEGRAVVHVVDNASTDATSNIVERLASEFDWLKPHFLDENLGFGLGNNRVLTTLEAKAHILLNADAWLVGDSFSPALTLIAEKPKVGVIGLPLIFPDGRPQTYTFMPSAWHRWLLLILGLRRIAKVLVCFAPIQALMRSVPFSRNFAVNHGKVAIDLTDPIALSSAATGEVAPAAWVAGAAMVLSPDFVRASGGFDPDIFLYGEDEDLCIQAHKLEFSVETLQTIPIVHKLGWGGTGTFNPRIARMKYESLKYFISKNVSGSLNRILMRALLPLYVYGWNIRFFLQNKV